MVDSDAQRLQHIAHSAAGRAAYFQSFRLCVEKGLWGTDDILEELERCEMRSKETEFYARGSDEAARQMRAEIHVHYRSRHPLREF